VIRWTHAGISPAATGVLWSESVAAEVLVFLFLGPRLLRAVTPAGAMAVAAFCGVVRWGVLAQTVDVIALGLVQPLHGLHLRFSISQPCVSATAQAVYGLVAVGGATAVLILLSGWLYAHFGAAGFWGMAALCVAAFPVIWLLQRTLPLSGPRENSISRC
jgi:MFS transporter, PPP family, 3-phenylpropionic acid transporter